MLRALSPPSGGVDGSLRVKRASVLSPCTRASLIPLP